MSARLQHLFELHCLAAHEKQHHLAGLIGDHNRHLDLKQGKLTLTTKAGLTYVFPAQILGIVAAQSNNWGWGWAHHGQPLPDELLTLGNRVWEFGQQHKIEELTAPAVALDAFDGHYLAMVATGISQASCYYRHEDQANGAFYLLLTARVIDQQQSWHGGDLVLAFQDLTTRYTFNHKKALMAYSIAQSLPMRELRDGFRLTMPGGEVVDVVVDEEDNVLEICVV